MIGQGSFGTVVKAQNRESKKKVAIKLLENIQKTNYTARKVIREVTVLAKMSIADTSNLSSKLLDIIIPEGEIDHLFIVMPLGCMDLQTFLESKSTEEMNEQHVIVIIYNMLCSLSLIHSMDILHRDIKPANILIDSECKATICDFGLSRTLPKLSFTETEIESKRSEGQIAIQMTQNSQTRASRLMEFKDSMSKTLSENRSELGKQDRSRTCGV